MDQRDLWDGFYGQRGGTWRGNSRIPDPLCGSGNALDLGCGNGKTVSTLVDLGYRVTGIDFSPVAIGRCRDSFGDTARFETADLLALPFGDSSFDYVTAVHVLEHLEDFAMPSAAREISRVMRPGAYLFVRSFTPDDMRSAKRSEGGILYIHREPDELTGFFGDMEVVSSRRVDEPTRFGTVRSRSECLMRKPE